MTLLRRSEETGALARKLGAGSAIDPESGPTAEAAGPIATMEMDPRAADWRVLLPVPAGGAFESLLLLGGTTALAEQLAGIGLARSVRRDLDARMGFDAAVLLSGASLFPPDVVAGLAEDAVLYWEVPSDGRWGGRRALERALRRWGFASRAIYEARPEFRACNVYLPADAENPRSWYAHRNPRFALLSIWNRLVRTGHPLRAVVATRRAGGDAPLRRGILGALPGKVLGSASDLLVLKRRSRGPRERRLIVLAFDALHRQPRGVVKVARTLRERRRIEAEQAALREMRPCLNPALAASLPEPLGAFETASGFLGVETFIPGRGRSHFGRERFRQFELAASWITAFHSNATVDRVAWGAPEIERWVQRRIAAYRGQREIGDAEARFFEDLRTASRRIHGEPFPLVWCHGDFNESNVLYARRRLGVVDWESGHVGLPLFDLLYYAAGWIVRTERPASPDERSRRFRAAFVEPMSADATSRLVRRALEAYRAALGLSRRLAAMLLALHWIDRKSPEHVQCLAESRGVLFEAFS